MKAILLRYRGIIAGLIIGILAALLAFGGNPKNMGFCIACFLRDTSGALGLHRSEGVQYFRPEIAGLTLGAFAMAFLRKERQSRAGSSPLSRLLLGISVMVGCLMFLGCPFRAILRLAGGDLNALLGLGGFVAGILGGVFFLTKGFSLRPSQRQTALEGYWPSVLVGLGLILACIPGIFFATPAGKGPGAMHAAIGLSLLAGLLVGGLAQRVRLCMIGGIRDLALFREWKLLLVFLAVGLGALLTNLILTAAGAGSYFQLGFTGQPVAHADGLWNFLGMALAGLASVLLGGCPMRQIVMMAEGNGDSAITVVGLLIGAGLCHNFNLASSPKGPTANGKLAVIVLFLLVLGIAIYNSYFRQKIEAKE